MQAKYRAGQNRRHYYIFSNLKTPALGRGGKKSGLVLCVADGQEVGRVLHKPHDRLGGHHYCCLKFLSEMLGLTSGTSGALGTCAPLTV